MAPKASLADVAKIAGVSESTVSRTLRRPDVVAETTRNRILAAIAQTGYVASSAARTLAAGRSDVIGVLVPSVTNFVFTDVLEGIYGALEAHSLDVQFGNTRYSAQTEEDLIRIFLSQRPAGLIVSGCDQTPAARNLLQSASCPVVQIMDITPDPIDMMVGFSHFDAARSATDHLIASGYRRIGCLAAQMDPRTLRRIEGHRSALHDAGLADADRLVFTNDPSSIAVGADLLRTAFSRHPEIDAVFCINDDIALGAVFEAKRLGRRVPGQLGVCGFNNFQASSVCEPGITSVKTYRRRMGHQAVEMIAQRLRGDTTGPAHIDVGFMLVPRRSTAGPS